VRARLLQSMVLVTLTGLLALGVPVALLIDRQATDRTEDRRTQVVEALVATFGRRLDAGELPTSGELDALLAHDEDATIRLPTGGSVSSSAPTGAKTATIVTTSTGATLIVHVDETSIAQRVLQGFLLVIVLGGAGVAVSWIVASREARRLAAPLTHLAHSAERLGRGDVDLHIQVSGIEEADRVGATLQRSAAEIGALLRAEREFSDNAGHQLRNALTRLRLRVEELGWQLDESSQPDHAAALEEVDRLDRTVTELLALARTGRAGSRRAVDLCALVRDHAADLAPIARRTGRRVEVRTQVEAVVEIAPGALNQALDIVLENAVRHGAGTIELTVDEDDTGPYIDVRDAGSGIDEHRLTMIFERPSSTESHGIGLPLAHALLHSEGGSIEIVTPAPPCIRLRPTGRPTIFRTVTKRAN
jgi:signal transduction histidine kinase